MAKEETDLSLPDQVCSLIDMEASEEPQVEGSASEQSVLGIHLRGDPRKISAEALESVAKALHELLRVSSKTLLPGDKDPVWVVSKLALNSITAGFAPHESSAEPGALVINRLSDGLSSLKREGAAPDEWDAEMLRALRKITKLDRFAGAEGVDIWHKDTSNKLIIDHEFSRIVEESLSNELPVSRGSVTGHVVGWKDDFGFETLTIQDESSRTRVPVRFSSDAGMTIQKVAGSRLRIWGELKRNKNGKKISLFMHDFEVLPDREVVSVDLIKGLWSGDMNRIDSVEFQRELRDEE